ncbi:MAG: extracellular solute-binding protein [Deltaproteobacteria bacterium]|nr:extracellular solute-binding protein [Deltaproteobacteria bacterium]
MIFPERLPPLPPKPGGLIARLGRAVARTAGTPVWIAAAEVLAVWLAAGWMAPAAASPPPGSAKTHGSAIQTHGIALRAQLKYPAGFTHFDYANPNAPNGGSMTLGVEGSFDKLNPYSLKGRSPLMLGELMFESLSAPSLDEPFSRYGLLAKTIRVADNGLSVTYEINPAARFSDGHPVTARDVAFSLRVLRGPDASPVFRFYYQDIQAVKILGPLTVRLEFSNPNPELPLIAGDIPILPEHIYAQGNFQGDFNTHSVGSGPYLVADYQFGKFIRYRRNPHYWGAGLGVNRGRYNLDEVGVKFYKDSTVLLEGLKAGEYDFLYVNTAKQWALDVAGEKWDKGYIVKNRLRHSNNAGIQGFGFNLRRSLFQDRRVRKALALALDFEWSNRTLFYGQYSAQDSYFDNSDLAATGLPSKGELALLAPWKKEIPPEVFTTPPQPLGTGFGSMRERLKESKRLLEEAGWKVAHGVLTHTRTGRPFRFTVLLVQQGFQRIVEPYLVNLKRLGIQTDQKLVDESVYENRARNFDFDMMVVSFGQSMSPGNEQRDYFHSSSAHVAGSRNMMGIQNPAVDDLVDKLIQAKNRDALVTATHALDRVLWHEHYLVPNWFIDVHRITCWNKFSHPARLPLYYNPFDYLSYWWFDAAKARELKSAMAQNLPVKH